MHLKFPSAAFLLAMLPVAPLLSANTPKKVLVVSVTTGFRHSSIPTIEKVLGELAQKSGEFTVDYLQQPQGQPVVPKKPAALKPDATSDEQAAFKAAEDKYAAALQAYLQAEPAWEDKLKQALEKLSPASLQNYDGVIFASTTGDLPLPDKEGFLDWIKQGHAFIGIHAASDTLHHWPAYLEMLGGEFTHHGKQVPAEVINMDPKHPATAALPARWEIKQEEIYNFQGYDPARVHELLTLDKSPLDGSAGHFPVAWCKDYGKGRVFYISFGHREDLWDTNPNMPGRINPPETAAQFQQVILGGIEWALNAAPAGANSPAQ